MDPTDPQARMTTGCRMSHKNKNKTYRNIQHIRISKYYKDVWLFVFGKDRQRYYTEKHRSSIRR
jgi:hypothetical protein